MTHVRAENRSHPVKTHRIAFFLLAFCLSGTIMCSPTSAVAASRTSHTGKALAPPHRSSAVSPRNTTSVNIYLVAIGDKGKYGRRIGCGDSLIAVNRPVFATKSPLRAALSLLLNNHSQFYGQSGLYNALYQSRLHVSRVSVRSGKAIIHLAGTLRLGGVCDTPRVKGQLRWAALQFHTVHHVSIYINGVSLARLLSLRA